MTRTYGDNIFERYVQSYNIPQPVRKEKQIKKTKTKRKRNGATKLIPINKTKVYYTKPKPRPIKPINAPENYTRNGVIYAGSDVDMAHMPLLIDHNIGNDVFVSGYMGYDIGDIGDIGGRHDIGDSGGMGCGE